MNEFGVLVKYTEGEYRGTICSLLRAGIAGSNPARGMEICLF